MSYNLSNSSTNRTAFQSSKQYLRFLLIKNSPTFFFLIKCIHLLLNKIIRLAHRFTPWIDRKYYISLLKKDLSEREKYPNPKHDFGIQDKVSDQKISIIVPTCNDGVLIKKCIKSLVEQTYKNLEIIIVNDGTDEKSRKILNKIKEIDKRIIVVDSNHSGVATARNIGLKQATAPFIMWCDSDDFFYPTTCEDMLKNLLYSGTDFATCETNVIYEQGLSRNLKQGVDDYLNLKFTGRQTLNKTIITKTDASLWNKIYKKEIIDRHNISFPDGLYFEDALFNDIYMINSKTAFYLNKTLYNYLRKSNSVMSQTFKKSGISLDYCTIAQLLFKYLKENSLLEENRDFFWIRFCQYNYFAFSHMQQKDIKKKRVELKNFINKNKQELIDTNKWIKKEVKIVLRGTYKPIMIWRNIKNYLRTVLTKLDLSKSSQEKQIEYLERKIREKIKS